MVLLLLMVVRLVMRVKAVVRRWRVALLVGGEGWGAGGGRAGRWEEGLVIGVHGRRVVWAMQGNGGGERGAGGGGGW